MVIALVLDALVWEVKTLCITKAVSQLGYCACQDDEKTESLLVTFDEFVEGRPVPVLGSGDENFI